MNSKISNLAELLQTFDTLKVLVVGEAMLDSYLEGTTERLCREAPVPIVALSQRTDAPGGAANTAVNVASLGAEVFFLSVIGADHEGRILADALHNQGVPTEHLLIQPDRQTLAKQRVVASSQLLVRFDQGSTDEISSETEQSLLASLTKCWAICQAVLISDYGYGILTPRVIECLAALQTASPRILVVDAKNLPAYRQVGITACKPNSEEIARLLGIRAFTNLPNRAETIMQSASQILELTGAQMVTVTLDTEGAVLVEQQNSPYRTYATPSPHSKAAGAGDTFVSALTLALAAGAKSTLAIELASAAAAIVVSKKGTAACSAQELEAHLSQTNRQLASLSELVNCVERYRQNQPDCRIVFANGCFDILHRGHITFLNQAKARGDILIVAVNTDDSVRRLKGASRPIIGLEDRLNILESLSCVDHLIAFDQDSPEELVKACQPDVFIKGGNYTLDAISEAALVKAYGGVVEILPYLPDYSTSSIMARIHKVIEAQPTMPATELAESFAATEKTHPYAVAAPSYLDTAFSEMAQVEI